MRQHTVLRVINLISASKSFKLQVRCLNTIEIKPRDEGRQEVVREVTFPQIITTQTQPSKRPSDIQTRDVLPLTPPTSIHPLKTVTVQTCGKLYEEWKEYKWEYRTAPRDGVQVKLEYADTGINEDQPVVVALHGAPGCPDDYSHIIMGLTQSPHVRARLIAPQWPRMDLFHSTNRVFRHSAEEKYHLLKDFLQQIGVKRIDCMITHSSAIYPAMLLHEDATAPPIRSFCLFSPAGHRPPKAMRPVWFSKNIIHLYEWDAGVRFSQFLGPKLLPLIGVKVDVSDISKPALSGYTMKYAGLYRLGDQLRRLKNSRLPILYAYGERDKLVDKSIYEEIGGILGGTERQTWIYDLRERIQKKSMEARPVLDLKRDPLEILRYRTGGHWVYNRARDSIVRHVERFVKSVLAIERN